MIKIFSAFSVLSEALEEPGIGGKFISNENEKCTIVKMIGTAILGIIDSNLDKKKNLREIS